MSRSLHCVLAFLVACSSSTKSEAPTAGKPSAARKPADAAKAPSGSASADPWARSPAVDPAADAVALRADVDVMCGAAKATGGTTFMQVGPYIAEHMQTGEKVALFADYRTRTLDEMLERMRALVAKAGVQHCDTIDVLVANDPRKHD